MSSEDTKHTQVEIGPEDGAILIKREGIEFFVPNIDDVDPNDEQCAHVINVLSFLMYAYDREDWLAEFLLDAEALAKEAAAEEEASKRPQLRVIPGGKKD